MVILCMSMAALAVSVSARRTFTNDKVFGGKEVNHWFNQEDPLKVRSCFVTRNKKIQVCICMKN